jgi:hypothetical protein
MIPDYRRIEGAVAMNYEGADWGHDPDSGAHVVRLTSLPLWSHNISG